MLFSYVSILVDHVCAYLSTFDLESKDNANEHSLLAKTFEGRLGIFIFNNVYVFFLLNG